VYGDKAIHFPTLDARPLSAVVKVDYELPGCPMVREEFLRFVKCVLSGRAFHLPTYPVCVDCKKHEYRCLYDVGQICLGPITRAGCAAICPQYGSKCEGCRGILGDEALKAFARNMHEQQSSCRRSSGRPPPLWGVSEGRVLMKSVTIDVREVTRVEGHGNIAVRLDDGEITRLELQIVESPRF
jgi:hypothetical protein